MIFPGFDAPGRWWRGNLHGHSNASDGVLTAGGGGVVRLVLGAP